MSGGHTQVVDELEERHLTLGPLRGRLDAENHVVLVAWSCKHHEELSILSISWPFHCLLRGNSYCQGAEGRELSGAQGGEALQHGVIRDLDAKGATVWGARLRRGTNSWAPRRTVGRCARHCRPQRSARSELSRS